MHFAYAVSKPKSFPAVVRDAQPIIHILIEYSNWLKTLSSIELPRGLVFHDLTSATTVFSTHVLPAWTDLGLIHLDPITEDWKQIFLSALSPSIPSKMKTLIEDYYHSLDDLDIATIGAHEFTHHLHLFADTPEQAKWFEEGFCFYVPRKHLLSMERFQQLLQVEQGLIETHTGRLGGHPIWQFGLTDSGSGFTDALFDYWRAIHVVSYLGEAYLDGDFRRLLAIYEQWCCLNDSTNRFDTFLVEVLKISQADQNMLWLID